MQKSCIKEKILDIFKVKDLQNLSIFATNADKYINRCDELVR